MSENSADRLFRALSAAQADLSAAGWDCTATLSRSDGEFRWILTARRGNRTLTASAKTLLGAWQAAAWQAADMAAEATSAAEKVSAADASSATKSDSVPDTAAVRNEA